MLLPDVNIWVYAHREDSPNHKKIKAFVTNMIGNDSAFGVSSLVMSGFLRVVTHPKIFDPPTPLELAVQFAEEITGHPEAVLVSPGNRHWEIFTTLCKRTEARGNLIPDAYFAALAIESGNTWVTTDRDFSRFPGLDWKHPLSDF
ncbi:MAG: type II toxin-antitoxin system VapC family toxin [Thermodesulfobacteriota bacterium]